MTTTPVKGTASPATRTSASSLASVDDAGRNTVAPKGVTILPKAVVPRETELKGTITIGNGTVLHPSTKILAENGPIDIGAGNIIEEKVVIHNSFPSSSDGQLLTLCIGNKNLIETYAVIEGNVGSNNTISAKARIENTTSVSSGCVIGPMCIVETEETLPPNSVIIGGHENRSRRTLEHDVFPPLIDEHAEYLQKQLPNYHYILKSSI